MRQKPQPSRSVAQLARAPVSKTGGWGFESLHSCQVFSRYWQALGEADGLHPRLTIWPPVSRKRASPSGPVTDFRGEHIPQTGSAGPVSSFEGWAVAAYLELTMAKFSPFKFLQEVRVEADKVTWPTRRETMITTAMVFVMVAIASVLFLVADQIIRIVVAFVLGMGS